MTHRRLWSSLLLLFILTVVQAFPAAAQEDLVRSFQTLAERVITAFQTATDGVRHVRVDVRRPDTLPEADVRMVGMLRFDVKPKDGSSWYTLRCLFGSRDGRWRLLRAFPELPSDQLTGSNEERWYEAIIERVLKGEQ